MNECNLVLQGEATQHDRPFLNGNVLTVLASGCFEKSLQKNEVFLLADHNESTKFASTENRLQIYAGKESLAFRYFMPSPSPLDELEDLAGDPESYRGVSIGYVVKRSEIIKIDGTDVTFVREADISEISILSGTPAVTGTYCHIVKHDTCSDLEAEYKSGMFALRGKFIGLHRKVTAIENDEEVKYGNVPTPYEQAARRFERKLKQLA
jgi:hypothetical protein